MKIGLTMIGAALVATLAFAIGIGQANAQSRSNSTFRNPPNPNVSAPSPNVSSAPNPDFVINNNRAEVRRRPCGHRYSRDTADLDARRRAGC